MAGLHVCPSAADVGSEEVAVLVDAGSESCLRWIHNSARRFANEHILARLEHTPSGGRASAVPICWTGSAHGLVGRLVVAANGSILC